VLARVPDAVQRPAPGVAGLEPAQVVASAVVGGAAVLLQPAADNIGDKPSVGGSFGPQRAAPRVTEVEEAAEQRTDTGIAVAAAAAVVVVADNMPPHAEDAATCCNAAADGDGVLA